MDFEAKTKYFEKYTNVLRSGLGVAQNKIPLGQNVTFEFDYIIGTIDKIIVFNMTTEMGRFLKLSRIFSCYQSIISIHR